MIRLKQLTLGVFMIGSLSFASVTERDLSSEKWLFREVGETEWLLATVPGCVHTDLLANGKIPDPFYRTNEQDLQWTDGEDWQYCTTFMVSDETMARGHVEILFKGLDTYADVYLNGALILKADNFHRSWLVDVKKALKTGKNDLMIYFKSPVKTGLEVMKKTPAFDGVENDVAAGRYVRKGLVCAYTRKPHCHYGWDWGPCFVTSGIHDSILLRSWDSARIEQVYYKQEKLDETEADLTAEIEVLSDRDQQAMLILTVDGKEMSRLSVALKKGTNRIESPVTIKDPERWWTNGLGEQRLYNFTAVLAVEKTQLDAATKRIGLRTICLVQKPDDNGKSFYFELNGVPVFMKGANYIPQDSFVTRPTDEDYRKLIQSAAAANMNMLRVWGGGRYEKDIFYDLCDEYGILIWQDFMFANHDYFDVDGFLNNVEAEAREVVSRLRNRACLAIWCGNNEIAWHRELYYKGSEKLLYARKMYNRIFYDILPSVTAELNPSIEYWPSSPTKSEKGGMQNLTQGDYHNWEVWHREQPFDYYESSVPRFMSEFGFQSFPEFNTIKKFSIEKDWDIDSLVMRGHQKNGTGNQKIKEYMSRHYRDPVDFESFVYLSQLLQAKGIKVGIEAHRRNMPYCMGSLYWQLDDCWPVASWASIDYYGNWKALHYQARDSFAEVLISSETKENNLDQYIVSDRLTPIKGELKLSLLDFQGLEIWKKSVAVDVAANSSKSFFNIKSDELLKNVNPHQVVLKAQLLEGGRSIADQLVYFSTVKELELPEPDIQTLFVTTPTGCTLTLSTTRLAKNVYLSLPGVFAHFSDNYFDLLPGEKKTVHCELQDAVPDFEHQLKIMTVADTFE